MLKTVRDLMHSGAELPLIATGAKLAEAAKIISDKQFGCVGVVDNTGKLAGLITDGDLRRHLGPSILTLDRRRGDDPQADNDCAEHISVRRA